MCPLAIPETPLDTESPQHTQVPQRARGTQARRRPALKRLSRVMEIPAVYRLWQAPFAAAKFAPILRHNDLTAATRVLDVGCGPGTNARWFDGVDYLGLDINPHYVETARRRYGRTFQVADVRTFAVGRDERFDFILLNSLLHHIDTDNVYKILRQLCGQLTPCGAVHILELVLPRRPSIARCLARCDRGEYPRLLEEWKTIFTDVFDEVLWEPYPVRGCGMTLWNMVYFKGTAPRPAGRAGGDGDAQREDQATGPGVASTAARADDDVPAFVSGRNR